MFDEHNPGAGEQRVDFSKRVLCSDSFVIANSDKSINSNLLSTLWPVRARLSWAWCVCRTCCFCYDNDTIMGAAVDFIQTNRGRR